MDKYFKKERPRLNSSSISLKRPAESITPPLASKIPTTPSTPKDARLTRPLKPPPIARPVKPRQSRTLTTDREPKTVARRLELFKDDHPQEKEEEQTKRKENDIKISDGPLRGVSTSLLDLIRAKEAAAKEVDPEAVKRQTLLGIAPDVVRIIHTVFTASKREVLPFDRVVEKCVKGLKSNYTSETITDCINILDQVTPEWISTVDISRGKFMRLNRTKYTISQLLSTIKDFKKQ